MAVTLLDNMTGVDTSDFMRKSVYDTNRDGVVDKINKLTDITELAIASVGKIPKFTGTQTEWATDDTGIGTTDGGTW